MIHRDGANGLQIAFENGVRNGCAKTFPREFGKTRAEVEAYRKNFAALIDRAKGAIKNGATRDQLAAQVKTDDLGWQLNPMFYGQLYDELTRK